MSWLCSTASCPPGKLIVFLSCLPLNFIVILLHIPFLAYYIFAYFCYPENLATCCNLALKFLGNLLVPRRIWISFSTIFIIKLSHSQYFLEHFSYCTYFCVISKSKSKAFCVEKNLFYWFLKSYNLWNLNWITHPNTISFSNYRNKLFERKFD